MKSRVLVPLIFAGILAATFAIAQNQPATQNTETQNTDPLYFVRIAADVTANLQHDADGRLGIYVSDQNWAEGLKDSDLGPFLKIKEAKPGRSAAFLFSPAKDSAVCVYFDGKSAFGVVAVKAGEGGSIKLRGWPCPPHPTEISAAYHEINPALLKTSDQELHFSPTDVNTDDGVALPAFMVAK